ncbi:MAG TPA: UbiA family prenyltransferase [Stellaceae bacterium]|nr:UbiA family prenyltransferase [Stellaceae bacterium]
MDDTVPTSILETRQAECSKSGRVLVVDLDGSLVRTDTLVECVLVLARHPLRLLRALFALRHGTARLKQELAAAADLDAAQLPYHGRLVAYLREQQAEGRLIVLATGADRKTAQAVAQHLDLFDRVLASDGLTNLSGAQKLAAIRDSIGAAPFTYVGNSRTDLRVWRGAESGICVNVRPRVARAAARATAIERSFPNGASWPAALLRAIRPHQWIKNLLVFVPLVAARAVGDLSGWADAFVMFVAFCCTASAIYLVNDLSDLAADRQHPRKSRRPFASGDLPLHVGLVAAPLLLLAGFALSFAVGALGLLIIYAACSGVYSLWLKAQPLADVFMLAALYGLRLLAGGVAAGYPVSLWLLAFSSFLFLSLAMVKRVAELRDLPPNETRVVAGRGYRADDLPILQLMGVAASFVASLVLALYVQNGLASGVGHQPTWSWVIVPLVLFWECRVWLATSRGEMNDDPIVFAARDWVSWGVAICGVAVLLLDNLAKP